MKSFGFLLILLLVAPAFGTDRDTCAQKVMFGPANGGWRRVSFRQGDRVGIPRVMLGMRAVFVLPEEARQIYGVSELAGVIEGLPSYDGTTVSGDFVVRLDNGGRETIPAGTFEELRLP